MYRERYLDYEQLTEQLRDWATTHPEVVQLTSLGTSPEGREIWLLTLGPEPERLRPAAWVNANQHANEITGTQVTLAIAECVLRAHTEPDLGDPIGTVLREILVYVVPRVSPDGAETILKTGRYVRSVPRDPRPDHRSRWIAEDIDGDGLALAMRVQDPTGEFVASSAVPGLLVQREITDSGPFYKLYPEGVIANFDGHTIPDPDFLGDNYPDLNRNWPWDWRPEHEQAGAGDFPGSEPETQAVIRFASEHPNIFCWVDYHTFGGVFIRPFGDQPDSKLPAHDRALFRQLEHWALADTGYPMVSGFEEFTYEPDRPLRGDLSEYAYRQRGAVAFVCELWDLFAQVGFDRPKRFVDHYTHIDREGLEKLGRWDAEHNQSRCIRPWRGFTHPQLGEVEVGGLDPRFGFWNPPPEKLAEICDRQVAFWCKLAALAPRLGVSASSETLSAGVHRLTVEIENRGYLSTTACAYAEKLAVSDPLQIRVSASTAQLEGDSPREIGQLTGWGAGRFSGLGALYFARSRGSGSRRVATWIARGTGTVEVEVGGARVGWQRVRLEL